MVEDIAANIELTCCSADTLRLLSSAFGSGPRAQFAAAMVVVGFGVYVVAWRLGLDPGLAVALALGLPSFIFALVQFYAADHTITRLKGLEHQLSTRRLDEAPYFMTDIVNLLDGTKSDDGEVLIFCDFPAYGAISNPDDYQGYLAAVCERSADVGVRMLCLDEATRLDLVPLPPTFAPSPARTAVM
jgi:hypothetical protein